MKANIHPKTYQTVVTCACGNTFTINSTVEQIQVEVCSNCHPFYTGQMKYVDTAGRVDAFKNKIDQAKSNFVSKTEKRKIKREKRIQREIERPNTLAELRSKAKKN